MGGEGQDQKDSHHAGHTWTLQAQGPNEEEEEQRDHEHREQTTTPGPRCSSPKCEHSKLICLVIYSSAVLGGDPYVCIKPAEPHDIRTHPYTLGPNNLLQIFN